MIFDYELSFFKILFFLFSSLFGVYGDVVRVKILYNRKDTALVQFTNSLGAENAYQNLNGVSLFGKPLKVNFSKHQQVSLPKEPVSESDMLLTKDFSNSPLHRFKVLLSFLSLAPPLLFYSLFSLLLLFYLSSSLYLSSLLFIFFSFIYIYLFLFPFSRIQTVNTHHISSTQWKCYMSTTSQLKQLMSNCFLCLVNMGLLLLTNFLSKLFCFVLFLFLFCFVLFLFCFVLFLFCFVLFCFVFVLFLFCFCFVLFCFCFVFVLFLLIWFVLFCFEYFFVGFFYFLLFLLLLLGSFYWIFTFFLDPIEEWLLFNSRPWKKQPTHLCISMVLRWLRPHIFVFPFPNLRFIRLVNKHEKRKKKQKKQNQKQKPKKKKRKKKAKMWRRSSQMISFWGTRKREKVFFLLFFFL